MKIMDTDVIDVHQLFANSIPVKSTKLKPLEKIRWDEWNKNILSIMSINYAIANDSIQNQLF